MWSIEKMCSWTSSKNSGDTLCNSNKKWEVTRTKHKHNWEKRCLKQDRRVHRMLTNTMYLGSIIIICADCLIFKFNSIVIISSIGLYNEKLQSKKVIIGSHVLMVRALRSLFTKFYPILVSFQTFSVILILTQLRNMVCPRWQITSLWINIVFFHFTLQSWIIFFDAFSTMWYFPESMPQTLLLSFKQISFQFLFLDKFSRCL